MKRIALLALLALASCATVPPPPATGPTAGFGERAFVGKASVRPLALVEDSRCPSLVQCVWAGQVRISAEIASAGAVETRELILGQPVNVRGGRITLVDVQPAKHTPEPIEPRAYRFTFGFAR